MNEPKKSILLIFKNGEITDSSTDSFFNQPFGKLWAQILVKKRRIQLRFRNLIVNDL